MIAEHLGLAMLPFGHRPDTHVFHRLLEHQLAYSLILKAIESPLRNTPANQALFATADSGDYIIRAERIDRAIRKYDSESPIW